MIYNGSKQQNQVDVLRPKVVTVLLDSHCVAEKGTLNLTNDPTWPAWPRNLPVLDGGVLILTMMLIYISGFSRGTCK